MTEKEKPPWAAWRQAKQAGTASKVFYHTNTRKKPAKLCRCICQAWLGCPTALWYQKWALCMWQKRLSQCRQAPTINGWSEGAQKDPFNVDVWFDPDPMIGFPDANIGIACGEASGFFVLDVDGPEGEQSLQALENKHGPLPFTVQQRTGSGGRHLLFKMPNADIRPKVRLMAGLDVRGNDSYIVVAPSMHISGNRYEWIVDPFTHEIADPPEWLVRFV